MKFEQLKDNIKSYWNNRPCNVRHSSKGVSTLDYSLEVSNKRYTVEPHILKFSQCQSVSDIKILEVGCGIGSELIEYARRNDVTGIDLSQESIEICKKRLNSHGLNAKLIIGDIQDLDGRNFDQRFDLVYSFGVLHHFPDIESSLRSIRSLLGDTGELKMMVYSKWSLKALGLYLRYGLLWGRSFDEAVRIQSEANSNCPYTKTFTKREIKTVLGKCGFTGIQVKKRFIFKYKIDPYKKNILEEKLIFKVIPKSIVSLMERLFGWHLLVEAKIDNGDIKQ